MHPPATTISTSPHNARKSGRGKDGRMEGWKSFPHLRGEGVVGAISEARQVGAISESRSVGAISEARSVGAISEARQVGAEEW